MNNAKELHHHRRHHLDVKRSAKASCHCSHPPERSVICQLQSLSRCDTWVLADLVKSTYSHFTVTNIRENRSSHPAIFICSKISTWHRKSQSYKNQAGWKGHLTLIFGHELYKHNITNDRMQNQKNQHYISFVEMKTEMWNWQLVAYCSTDLYHAQ